MDAAMRAETIYKGATRPPMKCGMPLVPLVVLVGSAALVIMWVGPYFTWWIAPAVVALLIPALGWMRFVTMRDDQRFRQMFLAARLRLRDRNHGFWLARSYAPYLFGGHSDEWHR